MMDSILIESQYFPSIAYFAAIYNSKNVLLESQEWFEKRSFRNRCSILTANGVLDLSVPVHGSNKKVLTKEIKIDMHEKWVKNHWRAIQSAYGKSPFFDYYAEDFKAVLHSDVQSLFDLNLKLLTICLRYLQIDTNITLTTVYEKKPKETVLDLRSAIHPRKRGSLPIWFNPEPYQQIFGSNFVSNLSILDILFCSGPESLMVLKNSIVNNREQII